MSILALAEAESMPMLMGNGAKQALITPRTSALVDDMVAEGDKPYIAVPRKGLWKPICCSFGTTVGAL